MDIKPIETSYNGCLFRSRLEARWALFFDILDVKWEYEPKCFDLGHGILYLPDFWLPDLKLWIEIKPSNGASKEAVKKIELLSSLGTWATALFCGMANTGHPCFFFASDTTDSSGGDYSINGDPIDWGWSSEYGPTLRLDVVDPRILRDRVICSHNGWIPLWHFCCKTKPCGPKRIVSYAQRTAFLHHFER